MSGIDTGSDLELLDDMFEVKISLESRASGYVLVGGCSCPARCKIDWDNGPGAWEMVTRHVGQHVKEAHLKKFDEWA